MSVKVNTAALEVIIDAAEQLVLIKQALGLPAVSYVLGEEDPTEVNVSVSMMRTALINLNLQNRMDRGDFK